GIIYKKMGKYDEAYSYLKKSLEINPDYVEAKLNFEIMDKVMRVHDESVHDESFNGTGYIDYDQIHDIRPIGKEGGFGKVFQATWTNKHDSKKIALKCLKHSRDFSMELLKEIIPFKLITRHNNYILQYHGLTRKKNSREIFIVMEYAEDGNVFDDFLKNFKNITWSKKIARLQSIAKGEWNDSENVQFKEAESIRKEIIYSNADKKVNKNSAHSEAIYSCRLLDNMIQDIISSRHYTEKIFDIMKT
ncbi:24302_t:CDS:2, partial [Gigaspora margarita]